MTSFDGTGSPVQLGADLNYFSTDGWPYNQDYTFGDHLLGPPPTSSVQSLVGWGGWDSGAGSLADLCVFGGELHVAWVEAQWDAGTGTRQARGPYVKKWNGSAWVALGGEVEPDLVPFDFTDWNPISTSDGKLTTALLADGDLFIPARPRIFTDGTSLFCAYTCHKVDANAPNAPPENLPRPGGGFVYVYGSPANHNNGTGEFQTWTPRWAFVRKWNGATWDLYGQIEPETNNGRKQYFGGFDYAYVGKVAPYIQVAASAADPGVVYMALGEEGSTGPAFTYRINVGTLFGSYFGGTPQCFGPLRHLLVGRFDGGGVAGTVKEFAAFNDNIDPACDPNEPIGQGYPGGRGYGLTNATGTPYVLYVDNSTGLPGDSNAIMVNWDTEAIVQGLLHGEGPFSGGAPLNLDTARSVFYFPWVGPYQIADDGSTPQEPVDNDPANYPGPSINQYLGRMLPEEPNNIWVAAARGNSFSFGEGFMETWLYHRPCQGWTLSGYASTSASSYAGWPDMALIGESLYVVNAFGGPLDDLATDLEIRVYRIPIARGQGGSCDVTPTHPYLAARFATV